MTVESLLTSAESRLGFVPELPLLVRVKPECRRGVTVADLLVGFGDVFKSSVCLRLFEAIFEFKDVECKAGAVRDLF